MTMDTNTGRAHEMVDRHIHNTHVSLRDPLLRHGRLGKSLGVRHVYVPTYLPYIYLPSCQPSTHLPTYHSPLSA